MASARCVAGDLFSSWFVTPGSLDTCYCCYQPEFLAFLSQQALARGQTRNRGKALLGSPLQQEGCKNKQYAPLMLTPQGGVTWFLIWDEG